MKVKDEYVGSFYITKENTVGINVSEESTRLVVTQIIEFVESKFQPLAVIPSMRSGRFAINVAPSNKILAKALDDVSAELAQVTYFLPS